MASSLRWRLQGWHATILLGVVVGSVLLLYLGARRSWLDEIDAELLAGARVLEGVLRAAPPLETRGGEPPASGRPRLIPPPRPPFEGDRPPPGGNPPPQRPGPPPPPLFAPPRGWLPGAPRGGPLPNLVRDNARQALRLPRSFVERNAEAGEPPYFVVRRADGSILEASNGAEDVPPDDPRPWGFEFVIRQRGLARELTLIGPNDSRILVGRSIGHELAALRAFGWHASLAGLGVFGIGLLGGWWLSARAVRPIRDMSDTIAGITAANLSSRLDLERVDIELAELGGFLNHMLDRLETAFEQQARFTADASHELRTPLAVILSHLELARARPRSADEYRETLATCERAARRMKRLVDDLLTLARADAGHLDLEFATVRLDRVVDECSTMLRPLAEANGVRLSSSLERVALRGDANRLAQVVTNLVTNAIQYNRPGGWVSIATGADRGEAVLTVTDTGLGIAEDALPFVFERFYRVDKARSRASGGSGLGMAIVKSMVEAHGGRVEVTSRENVGTTITTRLPLAGPPEAPRVTASSA